MSKLQKKPKNRIWILLLLLVLLFVNQIQTSFAQDDQYVVSFLGDSITYGVKTKHSYIEYLASMLQADQVNNYGIPYNEICTSGKRKDPMVLRFSEIRKDSDLIFVLGGTNDWWNNATLGAMGDTSEDTFYGALHVLMKELTEQYPQAKIIFGTPLKRIRDGSAYMENKNGDTLAEFVLAIKREAARYDIPVVDFYHASSCDFTRDTEYTTYWTDGLHPNARGGKQMAEYAYRRLTSIEK